MSAVAGCWSSGPRVPAPASVVADLLAAMVHRCAQGSAILEDPDVALGQGSLAARFGVEGPFDRLADPDLLVVGDVRLDNRPELLSALGLAEEGVTDAAVLAGCYRRYGADCVDHLLGDFAFAIWDREQRRLFCARDHFGVKPLFYCQVGGAFCFASELSALQRIAGSSAIDEEWIADYMVGFVADDHATPYRDIFRLPAAHCLTMDRGTADLRRYWTLDKDRVDDATDAPAAFMALFRQAIDARLDGAAKVGAMLSGGLDSSAIAVVAQPLNRERRGAPLPTFSMTIDSMPELNERRYQEAVLATGEFAPTFIPIDDHPPLDEMAQVVAAQAQPYLAANLTVSRRMYRTAARAGVTVLLDGHGGDEVISHGFGRLAELARSGRWLTLWQSIPATSDIFGTSRSLIFVSCLARSAPRWRIRRALTAALKLYFRMRGDAARAEIDDWQWDRFIAPDLVARTGVRARLAAAPAHQPDAARDARSAQHLDLTSSLIGHAFEVLDRAAAAEGVEVRYPFYDKRVVEFCLALPAHHKLDGRWSRLLLRRAMRGILPDLIRERRDKLNFAEPLALGIVRHHADMLRALLADAAPRLVAYVKLDDILADYKRLLAAPRSADGAALQAILRTAVLALWLEGALPRPASSVHAAPDAAFAGTI